MSRQRVLLVEDDNVLRAALVETLSLADYEVLTASDGESALQVMEEASVEAVITDYQMQPMDGYVLLGRIRSEHPALPVLLMTAYGTVEHAVEAMLAGASDYIVKPFDADALNAKLEQIMPPLVPDANLIAEDPVSRQLLEIARKVAGGTATVLLTGESGVGKEVFARFIHEQSGRGEGPFVAINCAAIPDNMLEAMLFGHEKGAFTGAHQSRPGKFEVAQGGTLLLDEVSEMALELQAKLLRVLQEKEVERVGGHESVPLDVRIVATTNRDLRAEVEAGRFREDLYYRLSVFPLNLPPLRERRDDILPLARMFLREACEGRRPAPVFSEDAADCLLRYAWPGNVRELQNLVQRSVILSAGHSIEARDLRFEQSPARPGAEVAGRAENDEPGAEPLHDSLQSAEGELILEALRAVNGNRSAAAEKLGISPRTLRYKLARLREAGHPIPGRGR